MASESDQQELLLGNKQLLSIFFIVVVLLGVAFTIGYLIGKNTSAVTAANTPVASSGVSRAPQLSDSGDRPDDGGRQTEAASRADDVPTPRQTARAKTPESTTPDTSEPKRAAAETKMAGTRPAKPYGAAAKTEASDRPATSAPSQPAAGSYLQVAALKRSDADHIVKVLRDRGFPALLGESPKEGLFRVLVGPFQSMGDLSENKHKLRAAGFDSIVAK